MDVEQRELEPNLEQHDNNGRVCYNYDNCWIPPAVGDCCAGKSVHMFRSGQYPACIITRRMQGIVGLA